MSYKHTYKQRPLRAQSGALKNRRNTSGIGLWLIAGILIGILGAMGTYQLLTGHFSLFSLDFFQSLKSPKNPDEPRVTKRQKSTHSKKRTVSKTTDSNKQFEFYQLLPGMEVPISDEEPHSTQILKPKTITNTTTLPISTTKKTESTKPSKSISKPVEAPREIKTLKNVATSTESAKINVKVAAPHYLIQTGTYRTLPQAEHAKSQLVSRGFSARLQKIDTDDGIWYRVIVGPFASESMASYQKSKLAKENIRGILILQRR